MDPGMCPECGTVCADVGPLKPGVGYGRAVKMAIAIGVLPLPWAVLTVILTRVAYARMNAGMIPGTPYPNNALIAINRWVEVGYVGVLPVLMVGFAGAIIAVEIRRRRGSLDPLLAILPIVIPLGALCWVTGLFGIAIALWNE